MRVEEGFQQTPFAEEHPYLSDPVLPSLLKRLLPTNIRETVEGDLSRLGEDLFHRIRPLASLVRPATFTQYDQWGRRIDSLQTSEGWRILKETAIEEGYISIGLQRQFGGHSRTYMFAKNMVMTGDYHVIMCPLGMTDGAARVVELFGNERMKTKLLPRLISRDPCQALLSGQWMTERPGGSDVSQTETRAMRVADTATDLGPAYLLNGIKWFSSAAEGDMAVALARTGEVSEGSRGLSLFLVPLRLAPYTSPLSNGVYIHRLKEKIGTLGVPTAELSLHDTRAWLIGPVNAGVKTIAPVLNITRIHSAIHCIGSLQRCLSIARSYATVRSVKDGVLLKDIPMHVATLADINLLYRALTHVTFAAVDLLGKSEAGLATPDEEARLRLLTPAVKGYAAHKTSSALNECMAALGGLGYMEEVGIGRLIRDSLVEKIWEGTINILSLDLLRAAKDKSVLGSYIKWALEVLSSAACLGGGETSISALRASIEKLTSLFSEGFVNDLAPRMLLEIFACVSCGVCLLEHAVWSHENDELASLVDLEAFCRWVTEGELPTLLSDFDRLRGDTKARSSMNYVLVYGTVAGRAEL